MRLRTQLMYLALFASAGLAGCQPQAGQVSALPLTTADAPPLADAPPPGELPAAGPTPIAYLGDPDQGYAFADRAWAMSTAFGDSPPDYAFDDDGVTPWVWVSGDNEWCLAEAVPGGERYYYFEPGAAEPFFVEDPDYGYGYEGGDLVAVYDHSGRELPPGDYGAYAANAGRYLARGRALRQAAASAPKQAVAANNWNARRGLITAQQAAWSRTATSDPAWRAYHNQHQGEEQAHWASEAARRETWAAQTDTRLGDPAQAAREQTLAQTVAHAAPSPLGGRPGLAALPSRGPTVAAGPRYADLGARPAQQARDFGGPQAARTTLDHSPQGAQRTDLFPAQHSAPPSRPAAMFSQTHQAPVAAPMRAAPVSRAPAFHAAPAAHVQAFHAAPPAHVQAPLHAPPAAVTHAAPAPRPDKRG
jgi:hypothetical protein